jgi:arsenate reductase (glutaredoxin)
LVLALEALAPVYMPGWWGLALVLLALDLLVIVLGVILFLHSPETNNIPQRKYRIRRICLYFCPMIRIYGIKNCDTMQKAFKWLAANKVEYAFHNYKESGIDKATIKLWLQHFPADKLINTKGATFRALTDDEKTSVSNKSKAIALMIHNTSLIKRPVWDFSNGKFFLGWDEQELSKLI